MYVKLTFSETKINGPEIDTKMAIEKLCTALNNIEFLSDKVDGFMMELVTSLAKNDKNLLEDCLREINAQKDEAKKLIQPNEMCLVSFLFENKLSNELNKLIKDGLNSLQMDPIFTFLDQVMQQFNDSLTENNFKLIYDVVWAEIVALIHAIVESYSSVSFITSEASSSFSLSDAHKCICFDGSNQ